MKTLILIVVFLIICKRIDTQFINNPSDTVDACNGGTAYFNWTFIDTATSVLFVEWKKNGVRIALEQVASGLPFTPESPYVGRLSRISNAQISLGTLAIADSGTYTSEVTYIDGTGDGSNSIRLTVYDVLNNKTEIDETSGILTPSFIDSSITYTWTSPDNTVNIGNSLTVTVSGNYTLCVSEGKAGCLNPTIDPCAILYVRKGNEKKSTNDEDKVGIIVGSVIAVVGIPSVAALIVCIYKKNKKEEESKIDPQSREDPKVKELIKELLDWIKKVLADCEITVKDIEKDLSGEILQMLIEKLAGKKVNVPQSERDQKQKLQIILTFINGILQESSPRTQIKWSVDSVNTMDLVAILHLLVALARHYQAPIRLPENVSVNLVVETKQCGTLDTRIVAEVINPVNEYEETTIGIPERAKENTPFLQSGQ